MISNNLLHIITIKKAADDSGDFEEQKYYYDSEIMQIKVVTKLANMYHMAFEMTWGRILFGEELSKFINLILSHESTKNIAAEIVRDLKLGQLLQEHQSIR